MPRRHRITRRVEAHVEFYQVDSMQVVHNSHYLRWFELGRFAILEDVFPITWAQNNGVAMPLVEVQARYLSPARFGDELFVVTRHWVVDPYPGRLTFEHAVLDAKTKRELCIGSSAVTLLDVQTSRLIKDIPAEHWNNYLALR